MPFNLDKARAIVAAVKQQAGSWPVRVIVGGLVFNTQAGLWKAVGADAWAENARDAVLQARGSSKQAA
jgi:methanogenic corrinoid protein MtbC1